METESHTLIARAVGYFSCALIIVDAHRIDTARQASYANWELNKAPVAFLCAHGLEVAMKHMLCVSGVDSGNLRRYGHDLNALWKRAEISGFRDLSYSHAKIILAEAIAAEEADPKSDAIEILDAAVRQYAHLHSKSSGHALRYYPNRKNELVPNPLLVIRSFLETSNELHRISYNGNR